jgi:hypothetical protein
LCSAQYHCRVRDNRPRRARSHIAPTDSAERDDPLPKQQIVVLVEEKRQR